jgi:hypothetical protein
MAPAVAREWCGVRETPPPLHLYGVALGGVHAAS